MKRQRKGRGKRASLFWRNETVGLQRNVRRGGGGSLTGSYNDAGVCSLVRRRDIGWRSRRGKRRGPFPKIQSGISSGWAGNIGDFSGAAGRRFSQTESGESNAFIGAKGRPAIAFSSTAKRLLPMFVYQACAPSKRFPKRKPPRNLRHIRRHFRAL